MAIELARWRAGSLSAALTVASLLTASFLAEGMLALLGSPRNPVRVANPPNFDTTIVNLDFRYRLTTNREGLRYHEVEPKQPGVRRVFAVGDSFTEGLGVEADQTFLSRLERYALQRGKPAEFINAGLAGTGPVEYARVFFGVGLKYRPDALLLCIYENDVSNMPQNLTATELHPDAFEPSSRLKRIVYRLWPRSFVLLHRIHDGLAERRQKHAGFIAAVSQRAHQLDIPDARITQWRASVPKRFGEAASDGTLNGALLSFGLLQPHYHTDALDIDSPRAEKEWRSMVVALTEMVHLARSLGMAVALVYLPSAHQYDPARYAADNLERRTGMILREEWLTTRSEIEKRLSRFTSEQSVPFLDLTDTFRRAFRRGDKLSFSIDHHWTPLGHNLAAHAIDEWLQQSGALAGREAESAARPN